MTELTQTQIEALRLLWDKTNMRGDLRQGQAVTAPTQAQIEAFRAVMPTWWQRGAAQKKEETEEIIRVLTAVAGVGNWQDKYKSLYEEGVKHLENKIIERCAQVAESFWPVKEHQEIAAAILALKD